MKRLMLFLIWLVLLMVGCGSTDRVSPEQVASNEQAVCDCSWGDPAYAPGNACYNVCVGNVCTSGNATGYSAYVNGEMACVTKVRDAACDSFVQCGEGLACVPSGVDQYGNMIGDCRCTCHGYCGAFSPLSPSDAAACDSFCAVMNCYLTDGSGLTGKYKCWKFLDMTKYQCRQ